MIALTVALVAAAAARLPPVDQCAGDRSFVSFRSQLRAAVHRKDAGALLRMVADDVMVDFGGLTGRAGFARKWQLSGRSARRSPLWPELDAVMRLGCARVDRARVMPALINQLEDGQAFEQFIALPGVKLRRSPSDHSPVLTTLNFHLVTFVESDAPEGWLGVALSDGRRGYVRRNQIRAALDYRAQFEKIAGQWRMTSFVEGD